MNAVVPDSDAMRGWKTSYEPQTTADKGAYASKVCPGEMAEACRGVRFHGSAQYDLGGRGFTSTFYVIAYEDVRSAEDTYDKLWERYRVLADPRALELVEMGEKSDGRFGKGGNPGEVAGVFQVRVGALILAGYAKSHTTEHHLSEATVKTLASMFTERDRQAERGEEPSTQLKGR